MSDTDLQLLSRYTRHHAEEAFAELVRRHVDLIHSAALRQVRSSQLAEEVAQSVFLDLAQQAKHLAPDTILTAWLYEVTRRTAIDVVRREARRQLREQIASEMNAMNATSDDWSHIESLLDEAMHALDATDRAAVLLRYFENKSLREVGAALGTSDDAAQKRVSRAVERLREFFAKRGLNVGASGLAVVLSANAVQAAPVGLAFTISTAATLTGTAIVTTTTATATKAIIMTTLQKTLITFALLTILGAASYKAHRAEHRSESSETVAQIETPPTLTGNSSIRVIASGSAMRSNDQRTGSDLMKLVDDLRSALHDVPNSPYGSRGYPPEEVSRALLKFGADRKEAFATLLEAASDSDLEVRKRAVSAMGLIGMPSTPRLAQFGWVGDPAPEAKPFLWKTLLENNHDLGLLALSSLKSIGFDSKEIPALAGLMTRTADDLLLRYLPEAIAAAIQTDPVASAPFISTVEALLYHSDPRIQFEAACALAKHGAAGNSQILASLMAGLKGGSNLQQLMALETLQGIGSVAEPALQAILEFGDTTTDKVMRDVAFKTIGRIKSELRASLPEVEQALKREESIAKWNEMFRSGRYAREDLFEALKEPLFSVVAAKKLGEMGASAQDTVPNLITALSGQDQTRREQIVEEIYRIDPKATILKVNTRAIAIASKFASLTLEAKFNLRLQAPFVEMLKESQSVNSEWRTQQELVVLAEAIAAQDQDAYRVFVEKLIEVEPGLTDLFSKPTSN